MADGIQNVQNAAQMQQGGAPSQMQQVQPNAMQQQQMMYGGAGNQPGVVQQGQVPMQQLSPSGGQLPPGQMGGGPMGGGQMVVGQVPANQLSPNQASPMLGGQMAVSPTGQMAVSPTGQMAVSPTGQMAVSPTGQMAVSPTGQMAVSPTGPMLGGQMPVNPTGQMPVNPTGQMPVNPTGQMPVNPTGQMAVNPTGQMAVSPTGPMLGGQIPVNPTGQMAVNPTGQMAVSPTGPMLGGQIPVNPTGQMAVNPTGQMAVSPTGQMVGGPMAVSPTGQMVGNQMVVSPIGQMPVQMGVVVSDQTITGIPPQGSVDIVSVGMVLDVNPVDYSMVVQPQQAIINVLGPVNPQVDPSYTMEVIGIVDPVAYVDPGQCFSCVTKTNEIQELKEKIESIKEDFERERDEIDDRYVQQMRQIEARCENEMEEQRSEAQQDEDDLETKLKRERGKANEVQLKLSMLQAELENAEKSTKRQEEEVEELDEKLRQVKNERDKLDELNRRLMIELQRIQQQGQVDKNLIIQLNAKFSERGTLEKEVHILLIREKEKVSQYNEKIIIIQNTVVTLEKQNREFVIEIEVLGEKLKKEKGECEKLRIMLSDESKDDPKQGNVIRELERKVKELNDDNDKLDTKCRTSKDQTMELNTTIFQLNMEKTKFEKLSTGYKEDVEELKGKFSREKDEVERLEEELAKQRREKNDSNNGGDFENILSGLEEKIRRLTADCDNVEEKYKCERREKAEFEDKFHRAKSEITDVQERCKRVDIERDSISRKCREISQNYEQKIRVLQQQVTELRVRPPAPLSPVPRTIPVPVPQAPTIVTYQTAPCYLDTLADLGISVEKYNEMKHQKDSIEQRYNALVELVGKYEDEVQTLERENKQIRLGVTDLEFTSINISKQETNVSCSYTDVEYRRLLDEKDYFEGRYKKEKVERENAEKKLRDLRHEKEKLDEKLNDVAKVITRYEQDARLFRGENDQLRRQIVELLAKGDFDNDKNNNKDGGKDSDKSMDKYKHDIDELHRENEEFKQLIDSLDSKDGGKDDKGTGKDQTRKVNALENEVNSLQIVIMELEKTISYQNKTAEDGKMQLEDEKWRLREHVQKLEDKVKEQVRVIDEYDRKMVNLRGKFTDELSNLGEKLLNEVDRNVKLEEHINHLQKHLADLDGERKEILMRFDAASSNETEVVRDLEDLDDRYKVDITELQNRLTMEMDEKGNLTRDIQQLLDQLDSLRTRENAIETQFLRERDEIKGHYEFEKIDILRQYHEENARMKAQLEEEKKKRKQLEDEIEMLKRRSSTPTFTGGDSGNCGDVNVSLDDQKRRDYLEKENKKLLYKINDMLSKKDGDGGGGGERDGAASPGNFDEITRIRRKLAIAEEERDKFERMKKELEYEMDRNMSKFENLQAEIERGRDFERKNREMADELRSLKSSNDELNRKQRDLISENDKVNRTVQDMQRDNRKLMMEIDDLTMELKRLQNERGPGGAGGAGGEGGGGGRHDNTKGDRNNDEIQKMKHELESKLQEQVNANRQMEKNFRDLQREMDGMQDSKSLMHSHFNQQKEYVMQQTAAGSVRGDSDRENQKQAEEWKRMIEESEKRFKNELNRIEKEKRDQCDALKREKDALADRSTREKEEMQRKVFDIEELLRRKESTWQSSGPAPASQPAPYHAPQSHGRDDMQSVIREKDSYIEQLKTEKYEAMRNFEREKNRMAMDFDMERNKTKKTIDELEDAVRTLRKQKNELDEKLRDMELKFVREKDRMEHEFGDEKRQLKKSLDRDLEAKSEDMKREYENKYTKIINDLEREKARLTGRLDRERGDGGNLGGQMGHSVSNYDECNNTVVISKYESENRQLQQQLSDQAHGFELEKQELLKRLQQEKKTIEVRLIHEKKVLEISVQAMTREIAKLKHERNEIRKNYKVEIDKLRLQVERGQINTRDSSHASNTREVMHSVHTSSNSHASHVMMSHEERHSLEKTIEDLKEEIRELETTVQKLERNHTEEIRFMVKNVENEKADLENNWVLERGRFEASIEIVFDKKLTEEKKKFENTMSDLRREVNCLQDQRRLLQMKITSNSVFAGDKEAFEKSVNDYKHDVLEKLQREYGERIERERRPLEDTIKELRREVEELRRERNDARANFRQEKLKLQEEFDRERDRLLQDKHEIKTGGSGLNLGGGGSNVGGRFKPGEDERVPGEDDPLGQIQKTLQETTLKRQEATIKRQETTIKRLETEISSLKNENTRLDTELRTMTVKMESLEIKNKHLAIAKNTKDKPRRYYGSGSPTRPSVLDGLAPSGGSQPTEAGRSPDRRYPTSPSKSGQRYPGAGSPTHGGRPSDGRYPGSSLGNLPLSPTGGTYPQRGGPGGSPTGGKYPQRGAPYGSPDRNSAIPGQIGGSPTSGLLPSSTTGGSYPQYGGHPGSSYLTRIPGSPSGILPSGSLPSGILPSGSFPSGNLPSGNIPSGILPSGSFPSGSLPSGNLPSGILPSGSFPSGSFPSGGLPSGNLPSGSFPSGSVPSGSFPLVDRNVPGSGRMTLGVLQNLSPTHRDPSDRSPLGGNFVASRDTFVNTFSTTAVNRNSALHHRSLSAEFLAGRGTGVSMGGRPQVMLSQPFGCGGGTSLPGVGAFTGYGIQTGYTGARHIYSRDGVPGSYGLVGGLQGYRDGPGGYVGNGQIIGLVVDGYDGYIDDSGLGMDGRCGPHGDHGNQGGQEKPTISIDPPQDQSPKEEVEDAGQEKAAVKIAGLESPDQEQVVAGQHPEMKDGGGGVSPSAGAGHKDSSFSACSSSTNSDSEKDD